MKVQTDPLPDDEDGGDDEPSLGAPEGHASQVVWLRGADEDREAAASNAMLPAVTMDQQQGEIPPAPRPWSGYGNIVAAVVAGLLDMIMGR